ncbi:MAG: hypothetical protein ACLQMS_16825 [Desulfomonilaceae bacterium]
MKLKKNIMVDGKSSTSSFLKLEEYWKGFLMNHMEFLTLETISGRQVTSHKAAHLNGYFQNSKEILFNLNV